MTEAPPSLIRSSVIDSDNLIDWLDWLESLDPSKIELGLGRIEEVYQRLPKIDKATKVVTIAGTNGKGSCLTALQGLALALGKEVMAFSSPHLLKYNERIQIQGKMVADAELVQAFKSIARAQQSTFITYFEFATLAALYIAAQRKPELLILEVGLGGRLDSVNLIDADIAVITAIGMDHMEWLGNDIESIAREKCGIIRPNIPVILAGEDMPKVVRGIAEDNSCEIYALGENYFLESRKGRWKLKTSSGNLSLGRLKLHHCSVAAALIALDLIWSGRLAELSNTLTNLSMPGRFQRLVIGEKQSILDVAHNPMAIANLVESLKHEQTDKVDIVFATMADKDYGASLDLLAPHVNHWYLLRLDHPRVLAATKLKSMLTDRGIEQATLLDNNQISLSGLFSYKKGATSLLVTGSFYTVAAVMNYLQN